MREFTPIRTALFVPGTRTDRVDKAVGVGADIVIIDLEDAVPLDMKVQTRTPVREKIVEHADKKVFVRVNALDTEYAVDDVREIVVKELTGIMFPKVETASQVKDIDKLLSDVEQDIGIKIGSVGLIALVETALAVENAYDIAAAAPERMITMAFGAADFTLDIGVEMTIEGWELHYPRAKMAIAARAAGIHSPIDTPFMIDIKDLEGLENDAIRAKKLGFQGKLCIHPNQVGVCNRIFAPTKEEIEFAQKAVLAFEEAETNGSAAIQINGKFIDYPIVERARRILHLAEANNS